MEEKDFSKYGATLNVEIIAVENPTKLFYGYTVRLEVLQMVLLPLHEHIAVSAVTWARSAVGISGKKKFPETVKETVGEFIDHFINDYLSANA